MLHWDNRGYHQQLNHWRVTPNKTIVTYLVNKNTKKEINKQKVYIQTIYSDFSVYLLNSPLKILVRNNIINELSQ